MEDGASQANGDSSRRQDGAFVVLGAGTIDEWPKQGTKLRDDEQG